MPNHQLDFELRRYVDEHPEGWGHDQWLGFLRYLSEDGHDVSHSDALGLALEHLRLVKVLEHMEIKGLGPKRIEAIAKRYGTLWNLMAASPDDVASLPSVNRSLAEQILEVLQ
jgi:hypothetical protein